jgi:hypothetical protein
MPVLMIGIRRNAPKRCADGDSVETTCKALRRLAGNINVGDAVA